MVYMCVSVGLYMYVHMSMSVAMLIYLHDVYVCIGLYMYVHMCMSVAVLIYLHGVYVCIFWSVCACIYVCVHAVHVQYMSIKCHHTINNNSNYLSSTVSIV